MALVTPITIRTYGESGRGYMGTVEFPQDLPFTIARTYFIYDVQGDEARGQHAHRHAQQLVCAIAGSLEMEFDNGFEKETYLLNDPSKGLLMVGGLWRTMRNFSPDAILLVITDQPYNEEDLIRDYEEFKQFATRDKAENL